MKKLPAILLIAFSLCSCASSHINHEWAPVSGASVSYLGPEGTYTGQAAMLLFGEEASYAAQKTVGDAVSAMLEGTCDYAVIPQENTVGGPVTAYIDELLSHDDVSVVCQLPPP